MKGPRTSATTPHPPGGPQLRLGLVGRSIAHSRSPALHRAGLDALGVGGVYTLLPCATDVDAERAFARVAEGELTGLNVTTPYKGLAAARAATHWVCGAEGTLTRADDRLAAVNTLWRGDDGRLHATSTDGAGLGLGLRHAGLWPGAGPRSGRPPLPGRVAILGAGGAAVALATWLARAGSEVTWVCNRDPRRARALAERAGAVAVPWREPAALAAADWVIHATGLGHGCSGAAAVAAGQGLAHLPWRAWASRSCLVDIVYAHGPTAAQRLAVAAGARAWPAIGLDLGDTPGQGALQHGGRVWLRSGEAMLAGQAALSLGAWARRPPPVAAMLEVVS